MCSYFDIIDSDFYSRNSSFHFQWHGSKIMLSDCPRDDRVSVWDDWLKFLGLY